MRLTLRLRQAMRALATPVGALWAAAGTALIAATATLGFLTLFTTFVPYDDEGSSLINIKAYLSGARLYDQTFSVYGPFHYEFMAVAFKLLGLHVSNDTARLLTLGLWLAAALLLALAAYRLTKNPLLAAVVYVLGFYVLTGAPNEPTLAGHLLVLLLAGTVAVAGFSGGRRPRLAFVLLGMLASAALLTKVNIGVFIVASLVFAAVLASPRLSRNRLLVGAVSVCFVLVPIAVMRSDAVAGGYIVYSFHVLIGTLAVALVALAGMRPRDPDAGANRWLVYAAAGAIGMAVVVCGVVLAQGTSLSGLAHGVFLDALRQPRVYPLVLLFPPNAILYDAIGVALAAAVASGALPHSRAWPEIGALGRIVAGVLIWIAVSGQFPLSLPVALVWVAAVPTSRDAQTPAALFTRLFVPALAILQVLHAYPVAGSQIRWGAFPLVLVGAVCVSDGIGELGFSSFSLKLPAGRLVTAGALGLAIWVGIVAFAFPFRDRLHVYREGQPLSNWGAARIHVPQDTAHFYELLVSALRKRCDTFLTMPGLGSLYLMSRETPPTWMNISDWEFSWDRETQQRVVDQVKNVPRMCAVRYPGVETMWSQGKPIPNYPLRAFILNDFRSVAWYGGLDLMVRRSA